MQGLDAKPLGFAQKRSAVKDARGIEMYINEEKDSNIYAIGVAVCLFVCIALSTYHVIAYIMGEIDLEYLIYRILAMVGVFFLVSTVIACCGKRALRHHPI